MIEARELSCHAMLRHGFFTREGGEAYLVDLPSAEMHRLQAGHFAVEDHLDYIATNIRRFYDANVARGGRVLTPQSPPEALAATR